MLQQLGRYRITSQLGSGGMGVVYLAEDTVLGRAVALKTLRLLEGVEPSAQKGLSERFLQEARIVAQMDHPGIVSVYDFGWEGETAYLVLEFVKGTNLSDRLDSGPGLERTTALRVLQEAAAALDYAHSRGVIHRDVKPANLLLREDGRVKVADFGIAKLTGGKTMTQTGMMMGTVEYMSPEQIRGEAVDGRSDQFALAVVAYQIITGKRPFHSDSAISLAHKIVYELPPPASTTIFGLPPYVDRVLAQALDKQPAVRYATCSEFIWQLEQAWSVPSSGATTPMVRIGTLTGPTPATNLSTNVPLPPAAPLTTSVPPPPQVKKLLWVIVALLVLALGTIVALVRRTPKAPSNPPVVSAPPSVTPPRTEASIPVTPPKEPANPKELAKTSPEPRPVRTATQARTTAARTQPPPAPTPVRPEATVEEQATEHEDAGEEGGTPDRDLKVPALERRAGEGDAKAMFQLGNTYALGRGVPRDLATGRQWYEKAAAKGHRGAMVVLGDLYFRGMGVPKDLAMARQWYEKAAAKGYREAMLRLGDMNSRGQGVPVDYATARLYYRNAAEKGLRAAMDRLGDMNARGLGLPQNNAMAKVWYEKAALLGYPPAFLHIARLYREGEGVAQDCNVARDWYTKAAAVHNHEAMFLMGQMYFQGCPGFASNKALAKEWFTKAADAGNLAAIERLRAFK